MAAALNGPICEPPGHRLQDEDVVRIMVSSGTTGTPKKIPVTRSSLHARAQLRMTLWGIGFDARSICTMGPQTIVGFTQPMTLWTAGGVVCVSDLSRLHAEMARLKPNHMNITPGQLEHLLQTIPDGAAPFPSLRLHVAGSRVSRSLMARAHQKLGADLWIGYGSTEVSLSATGPARVLDEHEGAVGYVTPSIDVQAVDADDRPLPPGEVGVIRVDARGQFAGYLDDEAADADAFRDGWFYPGDLGSVSRDGLVIIQGRVAEAMNLGGVKLNPAAVDELALTCPAVRDAAAFSAPDALGIERPWIAVVRGEGFQTAQLVALLQARWPTLRNLKVASIDAIPRNDMLKVERHKLQTMAVKAQSRPPPA